MTKRELKAMSFERFLTAVREEWDDGLGDRVTAALFNELDRRTMQLKPRFMAGDAQARNALEKLAAAVACRVENQQRRIDAMEAIFKRRHLRLVRSPEHH